MTLTAPQPIVPADLAGYDGAAAQPATAYPAARDSAAAAPPTPFEARHHDLPSRVAAATLERHWAPKPSGEADPAGHLTPQQIDALGHELDAMREELLATRGAADAAYIRGLIAFHHRLELGSRVVLLFSSNPIAWLAGTVGLSVAKILDNMEIGHNVLHGQWDWMRDPKIHSTTWEWDNVATAKGWKYTHNQLHHTYTNVIGMDNDLGYGIIRVDPDQPWEPRHLAQPIVNFINAVIFQEGIAMYDLDVDRNRPEATPQEKAAFRADVTATAKKFARHAFRDYLLHPALSGPNFVPTLAANLVANTARNVWSNAVIICGHFPSGVATFSKESIEEETRGEWYLRQILGSANISGGRLIHLMSGNLSHQIEHHMFPDVPSNKYIEVAPRVRAICERYGLHYETGPMPQQLASVWHKVFVYALPNGAWDDLRDRPAATLAQGARWAATFASSAAAAKLAALRGRAGRRTAEPATA
ncbi:MAG: acyl-CoA desaturase [Actinobacteria bacterium]|nr:acyl-CoA desaturase [Actinomycetota bacterium]